MVEFSIALHRAIAQIAGRQYGLITTAQLRKVGLSYDTIAAWEAQGRLFRVHRGVYRVGHTARCTEADYLAATLACGDDSFLAGRALAHHFRVIGGRPAPPEIVAKGVKNHEGIITRRAKLHPLDTTKHRLIPCLTVPALLVDLAPQLTLGELGKVAQKADALYKVGVDAVAAVARRHGRFTGIGKLRELYIGDAPIILSELEQRFHVLLADHGFPRPTSNRREQEGFVDCRFAQHRLTVELDSYRFHRTRESWEAHHHRRRAARRRGDEFRVYTWHDVAEDQTHMLAELAELLPR